MILNYDIWGQPNTFVNAGGPATQAYDIYKRPVNVYADILADNPDLRYPYYEKSTYRWGMPADCSAARLSTCSWWADTNGNLLKYEINEPIINTNVGVTIKLSTGGTDSYAQQNTTYAERQDSWEKYPPYTKMQNTIIDSSGSQAWTNGGSQAYSHKLQYERRFNTPSQTTSTNQCVKFVYNENVVAACGTYVKLKRDTNIPSGKTGTIDSLITAMRTAYTNDSSADKNVSDYAITGISGAIYTVQGVVTASNKRQKRSSSGAYLHFCAAYEPSSRWKRIYYNNDALKPTSVVCGNFQIGLGGTCNDTVANYSMGWYPNQYYPRKYTFFNNVTNPYSGTTNYMQSCDMCLSVSQKKQVFSDVSYHWEWGIRVNGTTYLFGANDMPAVAGQTNWGTVVIFPVLIIDKFDNSLGDYFDACKRACLHEISFYGLPFTTSTAIATSTVWDTNATNIYIPTFDNNMMTTGMYDTVAHQGTTNPNGQFKWGDIFSAVEDIDKYNPDYQPKIISVDENDRGDLANNFRFNKMPTPLTVWAFTESNFSTLIGELNKLYTSDNSPNQWEVDFKGVNPTDYIVAAYVTNCDIPISDTLSNFKIGVVEFDGINTDTQIQTYKIPFTGNGDDLTGVFDFGTVKIEPVYNDFRDYEPYTNIELYIPLCGTVKIDTAFFMGHSINVKMIYDVPTMACTAAIYRDGITLYKTVNGTLGSQIPLLSTNMGNYQNTIYQLNAAQKRNEMQLGVGIGSLALAAVGLAATPVTAGASLALAGTALAGGASIVQNIDKIRQTEYELKHTQPSVSITGCSESQNSFCVGSNKCMLFIKRSKMLAGYDADIYGKTVGFSCCYQSTANNENGYTVCSDINTNGISATADEIAMIKQIFKNGVFL